MPSDSTKSRPAKPYEGFPMFAHPSGQWAKKINRKLYYFGVWADPDAALERLNRELPFLKDGRTPPPIDTSEGCTLRQLCNTFMKSKKNKLNAGDLSSRSFRDYYKSCEELLTYFDKDRRVDDLRPADFEGFRSHLAKRLGVVTLKNEVNRCRVIFKFAYEQRLIDERISFGQSFNRPSAKALRRDRNAAGPKLFERDEILRILDACDVHLRAMVLLGLNCAFGNTDISSLFQSAVNLETGWINFPRPKTEIPRRIPMWPETIKAVRESLASRPKSYDKSAQGLCFLTVNGRQWVRLKQKKNAERDEPQIPIDALSQKFAKVLKSLGINGRRGLGFYTLRHCFETIAGESKDQVAVDAIMGHVDPSMAAVYRQRISDERLKAAVETVRSWLFGEETGDE